jgi:hypothetical protein
VRAPARRLRAGVDTTPHSGRLQQRCVIGYAVAMPGAAARRACRSARCDRRVEAVQAGHKPSGDPGGGCQGVGMRGSHQGLAGRRRSSSSTSGTTSGIIRRSSACWSIGPAEGQTMASACVALGAANAWAVEDALAGRKVRASARRVDDCKDSCDDDVRLPVEGALDDVSAAQRDHVHAVAGERGELVLHGRPQPVRGAAYGRGQRWSAVVGPSTVITASGV